MSAKPLMGAPITVKLSLDSKKNFAKILWEHFNKSSYEVQVALFQVYFEFYDSGNLRCVTEYNGNIMHGKSSQYRDTSDEVICACSHYNFGQQIGDTEYYDESGKLIENPAAVMAKILLREN